MLTAQASGSCTKQAGHAEHPNSIWTASTEITDNFVEGSCKVDLAFTAGVCALFQGLFG